MTDEEDTANYVDAAAKALGLSIAPDQRPGVIVNFERTAALAKLFLAVELGAADEPLPVFRP